MFPSGFLLAETTVQAPAHVQALLLVPPALPSAAGHRGGGGR